MSAAASTTQSTVTAPVSSEMKVLKTFFMQLFSVLSADEGTRQSDGSALSIVLNALSSLTIAPETGQKLAELRSHLRLHLKQTKQAVSVGQSENNESGATQTVQQRPSFGFFNWLTATALREVK
ncbi:MAG: hypothetical protein AAGA08_07835 [Pseudomonadota bacterium]